MRQSNIDSKYRLHLYYHHHLASWRIVYQQHHRRRASSSSNAASAVWLHNTTFIGLTARLGANSHSWRKGILLATTRVTDHLLQDVPQIATMVLALREAHWTRFEAEVEATVDVVISVQIRVIVIYYEMADSRHHLSGMIAQMIIE